MDTLDTINEQQRRLLNEYQSVTHTENINESLRILGENHWNLELAIQNRYTPSSSVNKHATRVYDQAEEDDDRVSPSSTSALLGHRSNNSSSSTRRTTTTSRFFMWPFNLAWKMSWGLFQFAARLLYRPSITAPRRDARSEADRFLRDFEHTYGFTHPTFFDGGYTQALTTAKKELKYVLIILCSEEHDDNDKFCRETLTNAEVLDFLNHQGVIVWGGNVRNTEAYQVSNTLQATTYPFLAMIALQNNKMAVIDRMEGPITPASLIRRMESVIARVGPSLNALRMEREQRELERRLRQEQDNAYQSSLLADQEKERKAKELREAKERQLKEKERQEQLKKDYIQYLVALFKKDNHYTEESSTEKTTKISFRLADGERVIRKFRGSDSLEVLYQFVEVYPHLNDTVVDQVHKPPPDYAYPYNFTIHSPFPRTVYHPDPETLISDVKGLWPSATLIVDTNDNDE